MGRRISMNKEEARKVLLLCEDLKRYASAEQYMELLDEYVRNGAWSGEAANEFRRELTVIETRVADDRKKFDELIAEFEDYAKWISDIDNRH